MKIRNDSTIGINKLVTIDKSADSINEQLTAKLPRPKVICYGQLVFISRQSGADNLGGTGRIFTSLVIVYPQCRFVVFSNL